SLALALLWLSTAIAGEIIITDLMQLRTFGEEVYTQFISPAAEAGVSAEAAIARAVMPSLPFVFFMATAVGWMASRFTWQGYAVLATAKPVFALGRFRPRISSAIGVGVAVYFLMPILALMVRAGSNPQLGWSLDRFRATGSRAFHESASLI